MGNSNGKYNSIYSTMPQVADWEFEFNKLQLRERDVGQLFKAFEIMDTNKSMGLSRDELLKHLDLKRSRFAHRVFYVFDIDRSGEIDFFEFAFSVWNYCTAAVGSLVSFTFDIYATGQNGGLTLEDMDRMVVEIHGEDYQRNVAAAR
jgi:Ca2+-binding EF-hand superfamily protein